MAVEMVSVNFCLIGADYFLTEEGMPVIRLFGKTSEGKTIVLFDSSFRPYFYVEPKGDADALRRLFLSGIGGIIPEKVEIVEKNLYGRHIKALKVVLKDPTTIPKFKEMVEGFEGVKRTFEYNIAFYKRYLIDRGLIPLNWFSVYGEAISTHLKTDIAVKNFALDKAENISYPNIKPIGIYVNTRTTGQAEEILSIEIAGRGFRKIITKECGEKEMVLWLAQSVKEIDPDIIFGYNSDSIAFRKVYEAAIKTGARLDMGRGGENLVFVYKGKNSSASIAGRVHIDIYNFIENIFYTKLPSGDFSLESVSKDILWGKKPQTKAEAILQIGEKLLPWISEVSRISGEIPFDSTRAGPMQLLEWIFTRKSFESGELVPNKPSQEEIILRKQKSIPDTECIHPPESGIQEGIALFDLSGVYTDAITEKNVSPETFNCICCASEGNKISGEDYHFCSKKKGFVPQVLGGLTKEIAGGVAEQKRDCLKILADAGYDYFGLPESRWYSLTCLKSTRTLGWSKVRKFIDSISGKYKVIYADSKSVFLKIVSMEDIENVLLTAGESHMEFGGLYKSAIFLSQQPEQKARYALLDVIGRVTEYGMENYRKDWCRLAKQVQNKVIEILLVKKDSLKAAEIARDYIKDLKLGKADLKDLSISAKIIKPIEQYEYATPYITAAKKSIAAGQNIRQWDTIKYIITSGEGKSFEKAEPSWMAKSFDSEYYIHNQIIPAALSILSAFGFSAEDLKVSEEGQTQLTSFVNK